MLDNVHKTRLRDIARQSVAHGLETGQALKLDLSTLNSILTTPRATFVTLEQNGRLRGCIGTLEPVRPLAQDVADNAWAAAFNDSRFPPLQADELPQLDIHISILESPQSIEFDSEQDLLDQLQPGIDGLILQAHHHRATFLPSVWQTLRNRHEFLQQLKLKAGLPANYWSDHMRAQRYRVESF